MLLGVTALGDSHTFASPDVYDNPMELVVQFLLHRVGNEGVRAGTASVSPNEEEESGLLARILTFP